MKVRYYKKKPVQVAAVRVFDADSAEAAAKWINMHGAKAIFNRTVFENGGGLLIETLEGSMIASKGDYIIRGVSGEFYPCKPDIFAKTYEPDEWFELPAAQEDEDD